MNNEKEEGKSDKEKIWEFEWMVRPCHMYKSEYKTCKSLRGRFHQLYVHGEELDCSQWMKDHENCKKWKNSEDEEAYVTPETNSWIISRTNQLMQSEKSRRLQRLAPNILNDVWTRRETPPDDWSAPLPDWLTKRDACTFLAAKSQEIQASTDKEMYSPSSCTII